MELKHYLVILRRWGWIMILCTVLASTASYWFSSRQPRVYESVSRYLVGPAVDNPNVNSNDLRASSQVGQTYAALAETRPLLQTVIDKLGLKDSKGNPMDPAQLAPNVTASWLETSQILTIRVHASDPAVAANVANALGDTLIERSPGGPASLQSARRQSALTEIAKIQETIRATEAEIDQLTNQIQQTTDQVSQRALIVRLDQRRAQLATSQRALTDQYDIVQNSGTNQIALMEQAVPNPIPIAPEIVRNVLAALIAGLVLGLAAMLLFEYFTDVIYTPEELRKASGLAYLGGIARRSRLRGGDTSQIVVQARPETLAAESYRMLRTNLQMIGGDLQAPSLLITSPARGDGKTEIAANLAAALAQAGKSVILVDANLRRPRIAALFGLSEDVGLSNLLDQPQPVLEPQPISDIPGLSVLPAGLSVLNSSDILGSQRMQRLLQDLKAQANIVILDSPPMLYSDALALAQQVDGVLLTANSGSTGRENLINAVESLRLVGAHMIGAVLNRVKAGPAYSYYPSRMRKSQTPALPSPALAPALAAPADGPASWEPQRASTNLRANATVAAPSSASSDVTWADPAGATPRAVMDEPVAVMDEPQSDLVAVADEPVAVTDEPQSDPIAVMDEPQFEPVAVVDEPVAVMDEPQPEPSAITQRLDDEPAGESVAVAQDPQFDVGAITQQLEAVSPNEFADEPSDAPSARQPELDLTAGEEIKTIDDAHLAEPEVEMVEAGGASIAVHSNGARNRTSRRNRGRS